MWIKREISSIITKSKDLIQILQGPRQTGKSSLFLHLDPTYKELSLDDLNLRELAQSDPSAFLEPYQDLKIFIDEAQYAPNLFPALKRKIDLIKRNPNFRRENIVRLTGSNQIILDTQIKESLAGRASFFTLNTLSVSEILNHFDIPIQSILYNGGWPELYTQPENKQTSKFLNDYISSYIEKDIVLSSGIQKKSEFLKFLKMLAGRISQTIDFSSIGKDCGIDAKTVKSWLSVLENMHIISLVPSYHNNLSSRLIKSPKLYFWDTGLACRLQGWSSPEPILTSPLQGALFENLVFSEISKMILNYQLDWTLYHWRSKDGEEIDFLLDRAQNEPLFIEAKTSPQSLVDPSEFREIKKVFKEKIPKIFLCHQVGSEVVGKKIPISKLKNFLLT